MNKRRILLITIMILSVTILGACSKTESKDISNASADSNITVDDEKINEEDVVKENREDLVLRDDVTINNKVFNEEFFKEIQKLTFWDKGKAIEITDAKEIQAIYELLASLKTTMYTLTTDNAKFGYTIIDFSLSSKKVQVGLLSSDMIVDGVNYNIDINIVEDIRKIAIKSDKEK